MTERTKRQSATQSSGSFRGIYVPKSTMEAVFPGAYELLPPQFRDRIPTLGQGSADNSRILRAGFNFLERFVDDLFRRLQHKDGEAWELWKLLVACYCVEHEIGPNALRTIGRKVYTTVAWPPNVVTLADALRGMDSAFRSAHGGMSATLIGGWPVRSEKPDEFIIDDTTPYPCALHEGVIAGICEAFPKSASRYQLMADPQPKREGGEHTRYVVQWS